MLDNAKLGQWIILLITSLLIYSMITAIPECTSPCSASYSRTSLSSNTWVTLWVLREYMICLPKGFLLCILSTGDKFSLSLVPPRVFAGRAEGSTADTVPYVRAQRLSASVCRPLRGEPVLSMASAAAAADRLWRGNTCRTGVAAPIDQSPDAAGDLNSGGQLCLELDNKGALLVPCLSSCMPALQQ